MVDVSNAILARLYCLVGRWQLDCIVRQPTLIDEEDPPILFVNRTCVIIRYEGFQGLKSGPRCSNECEDKFLFPFLQRPDSDKKNREFEQIKTAQNTFV